MSQTPRSPELFETTVIAQDFALGVVSLPRSLLARPEDVPNAAALIERLGMRAAAQTDADHLDQVISALLLNDDVDSAVDWLIGPPRPVPIRRITDLRELRSRIREQRTQRDSVLERSTGPPAERRRQKKPKPAKDSPEVLLIEAAAGRVARDAVVPYAQSPLDLTALNDLIQAGQHAAVWLVSPRTNPFAVVELPAGYLLMRAVQGVGEGVRRGLSEGVHYRLLRLFKVPDDWEP